MCTGVGLACPLIIAILAQTTFDSTAVGAEPATSTTLPTEADTSDSASIWPQHSPCRADYVARPTSERECASGLTCVHGSCDGDITCLCDAGATGLLCDTVCCVDCGTFGSCFNLSDFVFCSCQPGHTGPTCNELVIDEPTDTVSPAAVTESGTLSTDGSLVPTTVATSSSSGFEHNPCNPDFIVRPDSERICGGGIIECQYGTCNDSGGFLECKCDSGASGFLCETTCCLDCGTFGSCLKFSGSAFCSCQRGYTGPRCDELANETVSLPSSSPVTEAGPPSADDSSSPTTEPTFNGSDTDPKHNPCNLNFTLRPESERICGVNIMVCQFGVCLDTGDELGCECDRGGSGLLCEDVCCLECGELGNCFNDNGTEFCNCQRNFTGPGCSTLVTSPAPSTVLVHSSPLWYPWLIAACVLLVLLVLLVCVLLWMKRRRVIPAMQIFHYFQMPEDDDERQWDAFISYKSVTRDEQFVLHTLMPKLESDMNYKLHVHERDFEVGDTIVNNILAAIRGSRRTILIITPDFLRSSYTQFEYERALEEMLTKKHRIIPILLDDISGHKDKMCPSLKQILSSVTYIEWPMCEEEKKQKQFWKRLQLSMPKKRKLNDSDDSSPPAASSPPADSKCVKTNSTSDIVYVHAKGPKVHSCIQLEDDYPYDTINDIKLENQTNVSTDKRDKTCNDLLTILSPTIDETHCNNISQNTKL